MSRVVFVDTETTGLDPAVERIFELALIEQDGTEHVLRWRPPTSIVDRMHPKAVEVNRYHERTADDGWLWDDEADALHDIHVLLDGAHIVGAVPDFDARFLTAHYRREGIEVPRWHYHLIDVEALAVGYLAGRWTQAASTGQTAEDGPFRLPLPWDSDDLSRAVGVEPPNGDDRHTALGDARWVKAIYETICGGVS